MPAMPGKTDWNAVALLYEGLVEIAPAAGALVGRAAAVWETRGPEAAWRLLEQIPSETVAGYQPYWACAAHVLEALGRPAEARSAAERAVGLSDDPAIRDFLQKRFPRNAH
jgi:predicted RNA polymerase sigma factor